MPLRVVGSGPEAASLHRLAGPAVEFIEHCSQTELRDLYRGARACLLTGEEDFGIAPVEAQACGRPVIALARGGACETVEHETTGLLVPEPTAGAFASAIPLARRPRVRSGAAAQLGVAFLTAGVPEADARDDREARLLMDEERRKMRPTT